MSLSAILAAVNNAANVLTMVNALAPTVGGLVDTVEAAMPAGTPGAKKLEAFKGVMGAALGAEQQVLQTFEAAWPAVAAVVGQVVAAKKAIAAAASGSPLPSGG